MVTRIKVALPQPEYSALLQKALAELRSPDEQIRYMVREELRRCGLLSTDEHRKEEQQHEQHANVLA